jgi:hypothetical protein
MSSEVAFLEVRVGAQGVTEARNRLKELTEQSERAEKAAKKLADETERAEARKTKAAAESAAKADKLATTAAINDAKMRQSIVDAAAAAEAKKTAAAEKAAARADKLATDAAIREGKETQRRADLAAAAAAKAEAAEARKANATASAARRQEQTIQTTGQKQLAEVQKWLMTEEEALRASYLRRRRIIETQATGSQKQMLLAAQDYKYNQELLTLRGSRLDSSKYGKSPGVADAAATAQVATLSSQLGSFAAKAALAAAAYKVFANSLAGNAAYEKTIALLTTATGSAENAARAYRVLDDMENEMPASADELAKAFTRLVNQGLNPSERALRSYANIAAATTGDIEGMAETVANASMGNFKGLRAIGVKAEEDGNKIRMTFRGVTTSIGNDTKSIENYLIRLGEVQFAGATASKMNTLEGAVHKLKNTWDDMFRDIGRNNIAPLIKDMADTATSVLTELRDLMSGNWVSDFAGAMTTGMRSFLIEARTAADITLGVITLDKARIENALKLNDERQRQLAIDVQGAQNEAAFLAALKEQNLEIDKQGNIVQKRADALADFADKKTVKARDKGAESQEKKDRDEFKRLQDKLRDEEDEIENSFNKRQRLIDRYAKFGSEEWTRMSAANVDQRTEDLAKTTADRLRSERKKEVQDLQQNLMDQEGALRESYQKQRQIVLDNVVDDAGKRDALLEALAEKEIARRKKVDDDKIKATQERTRQKESLFTPYQNEVEQIRNSERLKLDEYQKARDEDLISAEEHALLKYKLHRKTAQEIAEVDARNKEAIAGNSAALFGNLAQLARNMGGEQSGAYKALFAMSKAFSIAQATMSIATGAAKALELGWPEGLAAGLQVASQGAGLLATITSSNYSGAYDAGGVIPAGRIGLVGERGPEFVRGPAVVTSRQQTAQIMSGQGQGAGQPMPITLINAPDTRGAYEFARSARGEMVFVNGIRRNAATIRQILGVAA